MKNKALGTGPKGAPKRERSTIKRRRRYLERAIGIRWGRERIKNKRKEGTEDNLRQVEGWVAENRSEKKKVVQ